MTTEQLTETQRAFIAELESVRAEAQSDPDEAWLLFVNAGFSMDDARALHQRGLIYMSQQAGMPAARLKPARPHLIDGEFQSDKYPTTPRGKVPLSCKDKTAQDLLWIYAQRRRQVDAEFADDLEEALRIAGYERGAGPDDLTREVERRREAEAEIGRLRRLLLQFAEEAHRAMMIGAEAIDRSEGAPLDRQGGSPNG